MCSIWMSNHHCGTVLTAAAVGRVGFVGKRGGGDCSLCSAVQNTNVLILWVSITESQAVSVCVLLKMFSINFIILTHFYPQITLGMLYSLEDTNCSVQLQSCKLGFFFSLVSRSSLVFPESKHLAYTAVICYDLGSHEMFHANSEVERICWSCAHRAEPL